MRLILHIGLHKTATKFLQHRIFPSLARAGRITYNPPQLTQLFCDLMKARSEDVADVVDAIHHERVRLEAEGVVLISREVMAGDLFSGYADHAESTARLARGAGDATIVCTLRYQLDWLESVYRESIHEHHYQSFHEFIDPSGPSEFVHIDPHRVDWPGYISNLKQSFEDVHFAFYEDLKRDPNEFVRCLVEVLDIGEPGTPLGEAADGGVPNRGYSAFAIRLSLWRYRASRTVGFPRVHRPIVFFGDRGVPAGFEHLSILNKETYWGPQFRRDNEEVRAPSYPDLRGLDRARRAVSWRQLMKSQVDRWAYLDWDLVGGDRVWLDEYFTQQNQAGLAQALNMRIESVPPNYFRSRID